MDDLTREVQVLKNSLQFSQVQIGEVKQENDKMIGKPTTGPGDRPRPTVIRCLRFKDKVVGLERAKILRGTYIFLNEDYPEAVCQKRKELIPAMKAARACGDIAYILYDRLIVHPPSQKSGRDERAKPMGS